jgi:hypothetical protein
LKQTLRTHRKQFYQAEKKIMIWGQALVAHFCNPSYSGGRDQEDHGSKPTQTNSLQYHISGKKIITKKGLVGFKV